MRQIRKHLEALAAKERKHYHPLIEAIHKKHQLSRKTLFYIKEYGPHSNVARTIIKESIWILLLASLVSSLGGLALESIKEVFVSIIPLVVLLPALNDMFGDYGSIVSSRFSTMLHTGKVNSKWWLNTELRKLFAQVLVIAVILAIASALFSFFITGFSSYSVSLQIALKILCVVIIDAILLVSILCITSVVAGIYFFKKKEDPNNFLIPIATSIADFGNMMLLSLLVILFF
jgi:mgtE-like transporter